MSNNTIVLLEYGGDPSMNIEVNDGILTIWLKHNEVLEQNTFNQLKLQYGICKSNKAIIFQSGHGDLLSATENLLLRNKMREIS